MPSAQHCSVKHAVDLTLRNVGKRHIQNQFASDTRCSPCENLFNHSHYTGWTSLLSSHLCMSVCSIVQDKLRSEAPYGT